MRTVIIAGIVGVITMATAVACGAPAGTNPPTESEKQYIADTATFQITNGLYVVDEDHKACFLAYETSGRYSNRALVGVPCTNEVLADAKSISKR